MPSNQGDELQKDNYRAKMRRRRVTILSGAGFSFIFNAGYMLALGWCALKVATKAMTYGTLTAVLQLVSQLQTPFANITKYVPQYYSMVASAERIIEIEELDDEAKSVPVDEKKFYAELSRISFENIEFGYGRETVLEEGNASLDKNDFVAIRGISGIGKSTLMKMLLGVYQPNTGRIVMYNRDGEAKDVALGVVPSPMDANGNPQ